MLQSTILRNSPKFKAAILQTSLIKESINMLSIIIFPNPPAEDLWNDPNNEHTQQHTPEKIKVENSAETRGGEIGLLRPGRKRWTIAVQEFRYRLGQARDHRFFAWIPRSALKHWHSAAEGNVSLGCNACLLLLSRHGRVHGVRASSRLSYSFFFFLFFFLSFSFLFLLQSLSSSSLSLSTHSRHKRGHESSVCIYTYPSCLRVARFERDTLGSVNLPMARQSSSSASSLREWCTDYMATARRLNASNRPFLRDTNSIRGGADRVSVVKNEIQRGEVYTLPSYRLNDVSIGCTGCINQGRWLELMVNGWFGTIRLIGLWVFGYFGWGKVISYEVGIRLVDLMG